MSKMTVKIHRGFVKVVAAAASQKDGQFIAEMSFDRSIMVKQLDHCSFYIMPDNERRFSRDMAPSSPTDLITLIRFPDLEGGMWHVGFEASSDSVTFFGVKRSEDLWADDSCIVTVV